MATELSLDPQSRGSSFESPLASVKLQWKKTVERVLQRCLNLYVGLGYAPLVRSVTERNEQIERKAGNGGKPKYIKFSSPLHEKRVSRAATCKIAERYLKSPERILSRQKIVWDGDEISAYENAIAELEGTVEGGVPFISRFLEKNSLLLDRLKTGISSLSEYKDKRVILARDIKTRNLKLYLVNEKLELSEIEGAEDFFINISKMKIITAKWSVYNKFFKGMFGVMTGVLKNLPGREEMGEYNFGITAFDCIENEVTKFDNFAHSYEESQLKTFREGFLGESYLDLLPTTVSGASVVSENVDPEQKTTELDRPLKRSRSCDNLGELTDPGPEPLRRSPTTVTASLA